LAHLAAAKAHGAELRFGVTAHKWQADRSEIRIVTDQGELSAAKILVTAGPWAPRFLSDLGISLEVRRKHLYWFPINDRAYEEGHGCPTYLYELPHGVFYGFPKIDELGLKVAEHSGGALVADPAADPRAMDAADLSRVEHF